MTLKAVRDAPCSICGQNIPSGDRTRPIINPNCQQFLWSHLHCIEPNDDRIPICKHWLGKKKCMYQSKCLFRHPIDSVDETNHLCVERKKHGNYNRPRIYNEGRAGALRRWLIKVFGIEYLATGTGVVDVAGGKGELSFELTNLNGVPSTVFDPRPLDLNRYYRKLHFGYYHRSDIIGIPPYVTSPKPISNIPPSEVVKDSKLRHIRGYFEMLPYESIDERNQNKSEGIAITELMKLPKLLHCNKSFEDGYKYAVACDWTSKGLIHEDDEGFEASPDAEKKYTRKRADFLSMKKEKRKAVSEYKKQLRNTSTVPDQSEEDYDSCLLAPGIFETDSNQPPPQDCNTNDHQVIPHDVGETDSCSAVNDTSDVDDTISLPSMMTQTSWGTEVLDLEEAKEILSKCSIIVGMHPDQATDHILEFALRNGKPFAIVPCCVYANHFSGRRIIRPRRRCHSKDFTTEKDPFTSDDRFVRHYGDLIEYLLNLMPHCLPCGSSMKAFPERKGSTVQHARAISFFSNIGIVEMDFEGKNLLIFSLGSRIPLSDPYEPVQHITKGVATSEHWWKLSDNARQKQNQSAR